MSTNKNLLYKGVKYSIGSFPLMFIGPVIIHSSFKNQGHPFFIPILLLGIAIAGFSAYLLFKGVTKITSALFNDSEN
ncbi:DUF6095 family protein [Flavobacterium agricola]|uniref:DUF6095 family protein n=1 Tax=Flavobacterium agricola TaxID=2870839 RepID=A0ABY6LZQ8_9FLAO|nr:DUF6095 family protein [Flavobacterium agricola]UYW01681.1 DUF6095 family protein [Flavobacterium agricola]